MEGNNSEPKNKFQYSSEGLTSRSTSSTSNSHWQDKSRDRKVKKRSPTPDEDWDKSSKFKDMLERIKKETNDKKMDVKDEQKEEQKSDIAGPSHQITASLQQQIAATVPQAQPIIHQPPICSGPYSSYGYGPSESYMDPNQGNYGMIPPYSIMPMPAQWPVNNPLAIPVTNVEIHPNVCSTSVSNGTVSSTNTAMMPYPYVNMATDSNFYGMIPPPVENYYSPQVMTTPNVIPNFNLYTPIILSNAVLTPPLPGEKRSRRPKPDGCRTVFVGNLPEKITQDIIKEAFERCGEIFIIRMSDKRFCHIRFMDMESVEQALLLSGYRIKIENKDEPAYNGKIHVDYAIARDDQHDFECRKRQVEREERHRQLNTFRPPSPPQMPHYSEHEATVLIEKLRNEETIKEGVRVLITWLERGECTKKNSGSFYSMLQSASSHTKKLANEKLKCEEEVQKAREKLEMKTRSIQLELTEIEKVYTAAAVQKNWDHFSKSQRRHIEDWKKEIANFSAALITARVEEDMDLDIEESNVEEYSNEDQPDNSELYDLKDELDATNHQLCLTQKELEDLKITNDKYQKEVLKLKEALEDSKKIGKAENCKIIAEDRSYSEKIPVANSYAQCVPYKVDISDNETCLVALISIFLHVHPFGASIDYICSYLVKTHPTIITRDIESLMRKFPNLFKEESTGIGATLEKKWMFVGFIH
ncbi:ecto-NOX disulfide-thiol exchanger 1 [Trichonephila inaurata madagascariensis]|uniref:Ecto-NOX disulfide-thiol exchanger 1 n=1 Tax=Trichonephila inaurata madagascariensis TaxID=2747483 RepID=A0A8X6WZ20_9ARAC|nr:ecto-NOX disulfide-thiol exchanger 1 [Trichonephila inaurata madagascariensis]